MPDELDETMVFETLNQLGAEAYAICLASIAEHAHVKSREVHDCVPEQSKLLGEDLMAKARFSDNVEQFMPLDVTYGSSGMV
jgi:hypothetical protein